MKLTEWMICPQCPVLDYGMVEENQAREVINHHCALAMQTSQEGYVHVGEAPIQEDSELEPTPLAAKRSTFLNIAYFGSERAKPT